MVTALRSSLWTGEQRTKEVQNILNLSCRHPESNDALFPPELWNVPMSAAARHCYFRPRCYRIAYVRLLPFDERKRSKDVYILICGSLQTWVSTHGQIKISTRYCIQVSIAPPKWNGDYTPLWESVEPSRGPECLRAKQNMGDGFIKHASHPFLSEYLFQWWNFWRSRYSSFERHRFSCRGLILIAWLPIRVIYSLMI